MTKSTINKAKLQTVMSNLVTSFTRANLLNPVGKTPEQIADEVVNLATTYEFVAIIDHTRDILKQARAFKRVGGNHFACLFYALWIEHTLNGFIFTLAQRNKLGEKEIENIVRDSSYRAKCTWLLHILGEKPFSTSHVNFIIKLMELRNSFVHYKWKPDNEQSKKELETVLSKVETTVKYIQSYETKYIVGVSRRKVKHIMKGG